MEKDWERLGFGTYPITVIPHYVHVLDDGTSIAMKLWLPWKPPANHKSKADAATECDDTLLYDDSNNQKQKFPAILEYLPYRKSDWTASRDHGRHARFCSHGYVCVRADQRGSGDSGGLYHDEYDPQEQTDCQQIITWLSSAQWSNGRVGMYGKSWGGFNGLQVAFNRPPGLSAVISLYSTDNRFTDDVHFVGDCVMANGMLPWSAQMQVWNARPLTPKYCENMADFKKRWRERLEQSTECWAAKWLAHQKYDDYWKHGSICDDYSKVDCPVLIIGGLTDGYVNAAFRMAAHLNHRSRAIIGPWNHQWPDIANAGPNVDYMQICLIWFDYYLKGKEIAKEDVSKWPALRVYCREAFQTPTQESQIFKGTWYDVPKWVDLYKNFMLKELKDTSALKSFRFCDNATLTDSPDEKCQLLVEVSTITLPKPHLFQGLFAGDWTCWDKLASSISQKMSNKFCLVWTSDPLSENLELCGFSKFDFVATAAKSGKFSLAVKLCHVWPDGESTLITFGICKVEISGNLSSEFSVILNATTYHVPANHKICIAISPSFFPTLYPLPNVDADLMLNLFKCKLIMQILPEKFRSEFKGFAEPKRLLEFPTKILENPKTTNKVEFELNSNVVKIIKSSTSKYFYSLLDLEYGEKYLDVLETDFDLTFCKISCTIQVDMTYKDVLNHSPIKIQVNTENVMTSTDDEFLLNNRVSVKLNDTKFFEKSWLDKIPRVYV